MSCLPQRKDQLQCQGWTRQFMASELRLSEAVAMYRKLGLEVLLEPVDATAGAQDFACTTCLASPEMAARHKVIFTRPTPPP